MTDFEYTFATDLEHAWLNFELDLPLVPLSGRRANPFYVERPGNPTARLERGLLRPYSTPPKYFFSGHRGCGKSTELRRLAVNPSILEKYWPVHFTIRNEADIYDLDFKDVLLAMGGRLYQAHLEDGGKLPAELLQELDSWRGRVETQVKTNLNGQLAETGVEAGLKSFFATAGVKMKLEPKTRSELRQVFDRNLSELVEVINKIAAAIQGSRKRAPLVLIDDLDKPDLEASRSIFYGHRETMLQPVCPIVYTVSSSLFYSAEFQAIRDRAVFLPNVRLCVQGRPEERDSKGYQTMRRFVHKRMAAKLITQDALDEAVRLSGGLFREAARLIRSSIDRASSGRRERIERDDVLAAAAEIRGEYRRFLSREQRSVLRDLHRSHQARDPDKLAPLLQILAALEYANGEPWWDVHPVLEPLLEEDDGEPGDSHERA